MSADKDGGKPGATGPGIARPPAETPARIKIRHDAATPGESSVISAADTAMALARDMGTSQVGETGHAATEAGDRGGNGSVVGNGSGSGSGGKSGSASGSGGKSGRVAVAADIDPDARIDDLVGTTLMGRYKITRKIGQGGMGAVFEATHTLIGKPVAVK